MVLGLARKKNHIGKKNAVVEKGDKYCGRADSFKRSKLGPDSTAIIPVSNLVRAKGCFHMFV